MPSQCSTANYTGHIAYWLAYRLFNMSPIYLIPKSQAKLKPYALVFFSLDNREGAQEEAQEVIRLSKSGEHNCHQHTQKEGKVNTF